MILGGLLLTPGILLTPGFYLHRILLLTLGVIADVECCYQRGGLLLAAGIAISILSYLLLIVGVVAEIGRRGLLFKSRVIANVECCY